MAPARLRRFYFHAMHPFDYYFAEHYAAAFAAEREAESARRAEAFLDIARPIAGISLRPLTAHDLLVLDGFRSPFVCGDAADAAPDHLIAILWLLRLEPPPRFFSGLAYRRHAARLRFRWLDPERLLEDHAALKLWFDDIFADSGLTQSTPSAPRAPLSTHFLAGLLAPLAVELGAFDPATGKPLIESPLCRLFQYLKTLESRKQGSDYINFTPSDRLKGEALNAWNNMPQEEKAPWLVRHAQAHSQEAAP